MKKTLLITGTRPQIIQDAIICSEFDKQNVDYDICNTLQHYDHNMSSIFFKRLKYSKEPKYLLKTDHSTKTTVITSIMLQLEEILTKNKYDLLICNGDTNTTLAVALMSDRLNIPFAHPESGYRRFNRDIPEETNRIISDHIAKYLFAYNEDCYTNLVNEGLTRKPNTIVQNVGDILYDAHLKYKDNEDVSNKLQGMVSAHKDFILLTLHRSNNLMNVNDLILFFKILGDSKHKFIFPVHPNTNNFIIKNNINIPNNITAIEPIDYLECQFLLKKSKIVITDSGGLSREAHFSKKFCIAVATSFEFQNLVNKNYMHILNNISDISIDLINEFFEKKDYNLQCQFGSGNAVISIVSTLIKNNF